MSEGRMRSISSRGGGIFGCKLDKRDSKKRYGPCSKHLYPSFPAGKVLSGHPSQVNWPGSGSRWHRTPRKHGWPRHTSATWPQNFPLNPLGHKQATTCEGRTMNSTADSPQEMNEGKMVAANKKKKRTWKVPFWWFSVTLSYWQEPPLRQLQTRRMGVNRELESWSLTMTVSWTGCVVKGVHVNKPLTRTERV